jgi:Fur family transcriptional regulator, ferric uptake regulator
VAGKENRAKNPILTVESSRDLLRASKLRSTPSRLAVLEFLSGQTRPISHAEISEVLVPQGYDKSTLYRVLVELAESEILSRIDAGDHSWRFEIRGKGSHSPGEHPHFVCDDCGRVECLTEEEVTFTSPAKPRTGKVRQIREVFLKGTCKDCS